MKRSSDLIQIKNLALIQSGLQVAVRHEEELGNQRQRCSSFFLRQGNKSLRKQKGRPGRLGPAPHKVRTAG
jgi:hypothetical protein